MTGTDIVLGLGEVVAEGLLERLVELASPNWPMRSRGDRAPALTAASIGSTRFFVEVAVAVDLELTSRVDRRGRSARVPLA